jgi:hypothetical protein
MVCIGPTIIAKVGLEVLCFWLSLNVWSGLRLVLVFLVSIGQGLCMSSLIVHSCEAGKPMGLHWFVHKQSQNNHRVY